MFESEAECCWMNRRKTGSRRVEDVLVGEKEWVREVWETQKEM